MKLIFKVAILALAASSAVGPLKADVVYDNGPIDGTLAGWTITSIFSATSSFTAPVGAILTSATVGLWTTGGAPSSLTWSVGTTAFGAEISSGTAALTSTLIGSTSIYSIYASSFDIAGVVASGLYYFTLSGGLDSNEGALFWDINNGPSTTYEFPEHLLGTTDALFPGSNSPSFTIYGETETGAAVPDAGATLALLIAGIGLVQSLRRQVA